MSDRAKFWLWMVLSVTVVRAIWYEIKVDRQDARLSAIEARLGIKEGK